MARKRSRDREEFIDPLSPEARKAMEEQGLPRWQVLPYTKPEPLGRPHTRPQNANDTVRVSHGSKRKPKRVKRFRPGPDERPFLH